MKPAAESLNDNPMDHPPEQPAGTDDAPQFARLFLVLGSAVGLIGLLAVSVGAAYS